MAVNHKGINGQITLWRLNSCDEKDDNYLNNWKLNALTGATATKFEKGPENVFYCAEILQLVLVLLNKVFKS